jgi:hypothetical protein
MLTARTRNLRPKTVAKAVWYGTIGGAALGNDAAPTNLASVSAARILRATARPGTIMTHGSALLRIMVANATGANATTLVMRPWFYDDTLAIWIPHGANLTVTMAATFGATTNTVSALVGNIAGARVYVQVVSNTALADCIGYDVE